MTLAEVMISITILSLISLALLGVMVSSTNAQSLAQKRNYASYQAAEELEKKMYSMLPDNSALYENNNITTTEHTLVLNFEGTEILCDGLIVEAIDEDETVHMKGFWPDGY